MLNNINALCAERDRLKKKSQDLLGATWWEVAMVKWYDPHATDKPPFLKALAEVRKIGVHEGWCYHHVRAIILSIDQYAAAATGNREYFWNSRTALAGRRRAIRTLSRP
jgi:hypothetical protein